MARKETRFQKLEKHTGSARKRAFVVLDEENNEKLTPESKCNYWQNGECFSVTVKEFQELFPTGELVTIKLVYVRKPYADD